MWTWALGKTGWNLPSSALLLPNRNTASRIKTARGNVDVSHFLRMSELPFNCKWFQNQRNLTEHTRMCEHNNNINSWDHEGRILIRSGWVLRSLATSPSLTCVLLVAAGWWTCCCCCCWWLCSSCSFCMRASCSWCCWYCSAVNTADRKEKGSCDCFRMCLTVLFTWFSRYGAGLKQFD